MVVNGREYEWASLFARLDQHMVASERRELAALMHQERMARAVSDLPGRIASAILASQPDAVRRESASRLFGWIDLTKRLTRLVHACTLALGLLLLAAGRIGFPEVVGAVLGSLK